MRHKALLLAGILAFSISFGACSPTREEPLSSDAVQSLEAARTPEAESSAVWINLYPVENARQIGGYPVNGNRIVRQNAILRTGELSLLTNTGEELLVNGYKLAHIIDLRDEIEAQDNPDPAIEGVRYHLLTVWPRDVRERIVQESTTAQGFDADLYIKNYYTAFALEPAAIKAYKEMFEVLLENDAGSVLIHCVHGKDRTGVAVTLILSALGVEWDTIEREYLLSNTAYAGSVDISSLRYYKSIVEANYGSMEKYLKVEMNLDEDGLIALREKYTVLS